MAGWLREFLIVIAGGIAGGTIVYAADSALRFAPLVDRVSRLEDQVRTYGPVEGRVSRLEDQVRTYAPLEGRVSHLEKTPDPVAQTCADLGRQVATLPSSMMGAAEKLSAAMQQLGCNSKR